MNPMTPKRTRRLRARAATMNASEEYEDYGPEPNMKLSHAFLVVLMLHVIAVGGLYAFNSMKAGKSAALPAAGKSRPATAAASQKAEENDGAPKGGGGPAQKPPSQEKAPPVAKVGETSKTANPSGDHSAKSVPAKDLHAEKGLFASAKGALRKAAGLGVTAAGASKAAAQTPPADAASNAAASPDPDAPSAAAKSYTVRAGDTMTRISSSLGVAIPDLEKVNGLASNAVLQVGQVLKVPEKVITQAAASVAAGAGKVAETAGKLPGEVAAAAGGQAAGTNAAPASAPATAGPVTEYTVVKGDNPWKIAKKFKISQDELMKANGITDPKKIQIGQQLKIPAATKGSK